MSRPCPAPFSELSIVLAALAAVAGAFACTGQISAGSPMAPMGSGGGAGGSGAGGGPPPTCTQTQAPALHARLLSPSQYNNTIHDLFGLTGDFSAGFGGGADTQLDDLGVEQRSNAATTVAQQAALALASWSPCDPAKGAPACEQQIIDQVGARAVRHPLSAVERAPLAAVFDAGVKEKDFATGVEWFLTGLLQLPDFLYQIAKPAPGEQPGRPQLLAPTEIASRLSYFIWDSLPDDHLMTLAAGNALTDGAGFQSAVDTMVRDARFLRGAGRFYDDWLALERFAEVARDDPGFSSAVVNALQTSLRTTATQLYASPTATLADLFSGQTYYLDDTLRSFYGLPAGGGTDFAPTTFPGEARRGLLTHPGLMALLARPNATNPIARGLFVRKGLLCQDIPPPPATLTIPPLPPIAPGLSTRDRLNQHTQTAVCQSCHDQIDPPGFALENWDQVGRFRTVDSGKAVDTSALMTAAGDLNGSYAHGDELLQRIATSADVRSCFAQHYLTFALSRTLMDGDQCSLQQVQQSFVPSGDLRGLVAAIAGSDAFRYRLAEGVAP